jgi:hypothetical protein
MMKAAYYILLIDIVLMKNRLGSLKTPDTFRCHDGLSLNFLCILHPFRGEIVP